MSNIENPRRSFIKKTGVASAGLLSLSTMNAASLKEEKNLPKGITVVFQGDSITDYGRDKKITEANDNKGMGMGYALLAAASLVGEIPGTDWKYYNRGISGNKVYQLTERWDTDCLDLKPDVVSILVGVNDYWHTFKHGYKGTAKTYEDDLRALLQRTRASNPSVKIILGQPFALKGGSAIESEQWFPAFYEYQAAAKRISDEFKTGWIPYQKLFDDAISEAPLSHWSGDGVHPSFAGCYLMAKGWMKAFKKLY